MYKNFRSKNYLRLKAIAITILTCIIIISSSSLASIDNSEVHEITHSDIEAAIRKDFPALLSAAQDNPQDFGLSDADFVDVGMLSAIRFVTPESKYNELIGSEKLFVLHIPLINAKGFIWGIFTIIKTEDGINCTLGSDFACILNEAKMQGINEIILIHDTKGIRALDTSISNTIEDVSTIIGLDKGNDTKDVLRNIPYLALSLQHTSNYLSELAYQSVRNSQSSLYNETTTREAQQSNTDPVYLDRYLSSYYLSNYPIVDQNVDGEQKGLCWAATVASIVRFEKKPSYSSLTAQNVADQMGVGYNTGGTNLQARAALSHYLGSPYLPSLTGVLSIEAVQVVINNIDPAYMRCRHKSGFWPWNFSYHAVALTGYNYNSGSYIIRVMDPAYESFKIATRSSSGSWSFAFGDASFTWYDTVRLLY